MTTTSPESEPQPQVVFRLGKKRKSYRRRPEDLENTTNNSGEITTDTTPTATISAPITPAQQDEDEEGLSVAEVLRLRNARKHKHGGVGFRAGPSSLGDDRATSKENTEQSLVLHDGAEAHPGAETAIVGGISKRFAPQTGLAGELVNKHMEEYVESELARRKRLAAGASTQQQQQQQMHDNNSISTADAQQGSSLTVAGRQADSQRVLQGRLLEIDLGEEARARNVEMTERARRRLQGQIDEEEQEEGKGRSKKGRPGRDGKPLRSRNRRGSDDIKRDQLVEEFLSENRLDVYNMQSEQAANSTGLDEEEDGAADDRIAEEFRREFMEAMAQRNRRRTRAQNTKPGVKKPEEILRGPKLGGSRNARAAMRDLLLKEQANKRK
ncbi:hypothetical protein MMYC01_203033 [Madurella mycetomatis]|uniref:Uncharacterized protein n=1 Tax=Madurella mycetomatis TaxID=100816 RepID=A0A175W619_9PEZI|nr:hypothetical protein MMYC01_204368 [Madurella mycetomatis]KXX79588.1 hypothetical protein MMYC01_203033 [Madurella mycetomatis]